MSVSNKLFEKGDYGVAGDTEARTQMKGSNPDIMDKGDNGFQKLDYGGGSTSSTPTAPVTVKDPTPKPKPKPKAADPKPEPEATPETGGDPKLGLAGIPWKQIAIVAGAAALIAALVALFKGASKSVKLRYNKAVKTLARMQKDFTMNKEGLDMRAVLPGIGSRLNDFFTRVLSGSAFKNNEQKGVMGRKSSRKYKDGVIGLYPFCGRIEEDIDNDFNMAQTVFSKIKLSADQQASSDDNKHTDESYNGKPVYKSFREAFNAGRLYESADGKPLNESFTVMTLAALASATVRGGMFIASKYKANKNGDMEKVKGGETAVQVTEESTREMCYAIMNAFFEKYISFEEVTKKMGIDVKGLSDIDNSTIDKFSQLLKAYSNPDSGSAVKQYGRIKTQYKKMCNHYFNIGTGVISNFKKYTKAEDEKHENLLIAANEKLNAMWDEQKDKYNDLFPYVLNEIIGHSHYQDYIDFIIEDVIPVFRTGIAGDADYILDVMPKKGDLFLLQQTAHGKVNVNGNKVDIGNKAIVEVTKDYDPSSKSLDVKFIGLYNGSVNINAYGEAELMQGNSTLDKKAYSNKQVTITYQKFMALDPHIIANPQYFAMSHPGAMPNRTVQAGNQYFVSNDGINALGLRTKVDNLETQVNGISNDMSQVKGIVLQFKELADSGMLAKIVAFVTGDIEIPKQDEKTTGEDKPTTEVSSKIIHYLEPIDTNDDNADRGNTDNTEDKNNNGDSDKRNADNSGEDKKFETEVLIPEETIEKVEADNPLDVFIPVKPVEEKEDIVVGDDTDYHNSYWTWNKRDSEAGSSLTMVLYRNKNNGEAVRFACILTKDGEKKYFNIAVRDGVEWSAFNKELESIGMKRVDSAEDVVNQTIDEVERNKPELRSVADTAECVSVLKDFVGAETDSADSNDEDNNKYYFWGGKKKVRGEEYTAHVCVKPIMAEGDSSKISRINIFMALRSNDDDMSELSSDSAWYDSITFKEPLNANDVAAVLKSNECNYLRECTADEMQKFDEGLYTYVQSKPENISYPFVDKAEEFKPEYLKQVIEKIGKDIDKTEIKGTSGAYVKLDNEHFITILPAFNNKGTDMIGLKCSYNDNQGNKITSALFSLGMIDKAVGKKGGAAFIRYLEGESIEVNGQKYDIEVISNVENQTDEAIKKAFAELKNVSSFDVKEKVKDAYDALRNVGGFVKTSIAMIGKEQEQQDIVKFLTDYCTEILKSIKVDPVGEKNPAPANNTGNPAGETPNNAENPANKTSNDGNPINSSLEEDDIAEASKPTAIVTVNNNTVKEHAHLKTARLKNTLLISFDTDVISIQKDEEQTELSVEAVFDISGEPAATRVTVSIPVLKRTFGKKETLSFTVANTVEDAGKQFAETIVKLGGGNIKITPQENPKGEALNDSIKESIKFNVSYEANDKIIESAAYNAGVTRRITSDKDASEYYVISECMWSCANDAATKKVLASKLTSAIKKGPTKYGLMEYAKANDNVEFSRDFADMSYSVKKPGNLHSIVGCSLFECAVAVKFNEHDNISNAIAIGVTKIY